MIQTIGAISIGPYDFNGFDTAVLLLLLISALFAFSRGLFAELTSIVALVFSAAITLFVYGQFRFEFRDVVSPTWLADGVLILGTGALSYLLIRVLIGKMGRSIDRNGPGLIDRLLGAGFGVARGMLIAALLVMFLTSGYRASQDAAAFRDLIASNPNAIPPEILEKMPESMREQMEAEPKELPDMFEGSTFYPTLTRIGDALRALPFADFRSYADRIQDGDFEGLADEIGRSKGKP